MHTLNLADMLPLTGIWPGLEYNPSPSFPTNSPPLLYAKTSGGTPFRLNLHVSDVGHTLILGPTGSGKSTLVGLIAAQFFRYAGAQVFVFDKGYSQFALCSGAGGEHYDVLGEPDNGLSFYPLSGISDLHERVWAQDWLETLFELQGVVVTADKRKELHRALELLSLSESKTLTELTLQDEQLRGALSNYTLCGPLGALLDSDKDSLSIGPFQVFELEHLLSLGQKTVIPLLLYLFHIIEQRLDGRPTLVILEEAWLMLMNSLFSERVEQWLRTLRKKNAAVVLVTQSLADITRSSLAQIITESCPTKIFLPNPQAKTVLNSEVYRALGLTERQVEIIAAAVPKHHYYYTSPLGSRLVDLEIGPVAMSFIGASSKEDLASINKLIEAHGEYWPTHWLKARGVDAA